MRVPEIQGNEMSDMYILPDLTPDPSPESRAYELFVERLKYIFHISICEQDALYKSSQDEVDQFEKRNSSVFLVIPHDVHSVQDTKCQRCAF